MYYAAHCFVSFAVFLQLQSELDSALALVTEACKLEQSAFPLPCTSLKLQPPLGQAEPTVITIPHSIAALPRDQLRIQVRTPAKKYVFRAEVYYCLHSFQTH